MGRIVVGVDGSQGSRQALRWAAEEAALRGARLEVVYVYERKSSLLGYGYGESLTAAQMRAVREDFERSVREAFEHAQSFVDGMVAGLDTVAAKAIAVESHRPPQVLVDRSRDAELLVVGSRGYGGFKGLLLGSVSQQCATHATCPVVIIRAHAAARPKLHASSSSKKARRLSVATRRSRCRRPVIDVPRC